MQNLRINQIYKKYILSAIPDSHFSLWINHEKNRYNVKSKVFKKNNSFISFLNKRYISGVDINFIRSIVTIKKGRPTSEEAVKKRETKKAELMNHKNTKAMTELIKITDYKGKKAVSARELHKFLEVETKIGDWILRMFQYGFIENLDYSKMSIENQNYTWDYVLTLECAKEISMLQRTEKGKQARQYFIEMEKKAISLMALPNFNNPAEAARAWANEYESKVLAESKVKELSPKAEVYDQIADCTNYKSIGEIAKVLGTGQKRLFEILRGKHILMRNNLPYQEYIDRGYFVVKIKPIPNMDKDYSQTLVTSKGELWLTKLINN